MRADLSIEDIEAALQGNQTAEEAVSDWCLRQAYRLAYADLGDVSNRELVAEEIAGEASLKAVRHLGQLDRDRAFRPWLHQIVRNCVRDIFRRNHHTLVPKAIYQRWMHDFLQTHTADLEALIQAELGPEPPAAQDLLRQRIASDLREHTYPQFMRLTYEGRANTVLCRVKEWVRSHVGLQWVPLYEQDEDKEWIAADFAVPDPSPKRLLAREFTQRVNAHLAELLPFCQRMLHWHYLDDLPAPDIARLEHLSERTIYRRLAACSEALRTRLLQDDYFADRIGRDDVLRRRVR